jgi:mannan endo-1,4-beta-mannosidase
MTRRRFARSSGWFQRSGVRRRRAALIAGAIPFVFLAFAGVAGADWQAAQTLSASTVRAFEPQLASDGSGRATLVWSSYDPSNPLGNSKLLAADHPAGGTWATLPPISTGSLPQSLQLATKAAGAAVVTWVKGLSVYASYRSPGGGWDVPTALGSGSSGVYSPSAAIDSDGQVVVAWQMNASPSTAVVQSRFRNADGTWSATETQPSGPRTVDGRPHVAFDADGEAVLIWRSLDEAGYFGVLASSHPRAGAWFTPTRLSAPFTSVDDPSLAGNGNGTVVATWIDITSVEADVRSGGSWGSPSALAFMQSSLAEEPRVAIDSAGDATAVWNRHDGSNWRTEASSRPAGGSWQAVPDTLATNTPGQSEVEVAADPAGDVVAAWRHSDGSKIRIEASRKPAGGSWQSPPDVTSPPGVDADSPAVAIDPSGLAVVAWTIPGAGGNPVVQAAFSDGTAPSVDLRAPADDATFVQGANVNADYSCSDEAGGSGIVSCTGTVASGAAIDTSTTGAHSFSVTATDRAGNTTSVTHTYTVTEPPAFVTRNGVQLLLDGQPYRPIGLNIYNANSNGWCWYQMDGSILDDSLTAIGPGKNAMRAWFFQQLATTNGVRDWRAFDRTLATARAHGYKVVATLIDQWGNCGATNGQGYGYKDQTWYQSGYKQPDPSATVSYRDWVQEIVSRYKDDPTILAWQLVNEPEALVPPCRLVNGSIICEACDGPTAKAALESFATDIAGLIKANDPNHLVSLGTIGSGQCGAAYTDYKQLMSIPTLDLCEFHDYEYPHSMPGDQYNGLQFRIDQCNELEKPLLVGEVGIKPSDVGGTLANRAYVVSSKLCAQLTAGVAGVLLWAWDKDKSTLDSFDIGPNDPVLDVLGQPDPTDTCSVPLAPRGVVAAAGDARAAVSWLAPIADGGPPITGYTMTPHDLTTGADGTPVPSTGTSVTIGGLSNGDTYTFTVTATNAKGTGAASVASAAVTPQAGSPTPAAVTGTAYPWSATTVSTGTDPARTGGTATSITVPSDTSGGAVSITQTGTTVPAPSGYLLGSVQVDVSAPAATATNPLTLVFTMTPPSDQPPPPDPTTLASTEIYRTEGTGTPTLVPDCPIAGQALSDGSPCVSSRQYITVNGQTYIQVTVLSATASHWNSARPKAGVVSVSDKDYSPQYDTVQPAAYVRWTFAGKKAHSVTDSVGLGTAGSPWFDSGARSSGSYSFNFPAAGTFPYKSSAKGDSMTGAVLVPVLVTPTTGRTTTNFSVIWSAKQLSGYVFDVQYRFKPAGSPSWRGWTTWKSRLATTSATFLPTSGAGTYAFRALLRNSTTGRTSSYSPDTAITAS